MGQDYTMLCFALSNPEGEPGYLSVPKLLRRTADAIDELGKVDMHDLVLHIEVTAEGYVPSVTVYYSRPEEDEQSGVDDREKRKHKR
jgi:hypothetical protein